MARENYSPERNRPTAVDYFQNLKRDVTLTLTTPDLDQYDKSVETAMRHAITIVTARIQERTGVTALIDGLARTNQPVAETMKNYLIAAQITLMKAKQTAQKT